MATAPKGKAALVASIGASAAYTLFALTSGSEGVALTPYQDRIASNVMTVCYGDTLVAMHTYTKPQCDDLLYNTLATFTRSVRRATPNFGSLKDGQKVAAVDFAYNAGLANWTSSTTNAMYKRSEFPAACHQYLRWRFAGKKDCALASSNCPGIMKRRQNEEAACLGE